MIIGCLSFFISFIFFASVPVFSKQVLPFSFCPKYNPRIMYQLYQPFVNYLNETTPYQFEIKLSRIYQNAIDRLGRGEILIASRAPVSYIKAREKYGVKPILRALSKDGKPYYRGIIIIRQDSPIQNLSDLKGKLTSRVAHEINNPLGALLKGESKGTGLGLWITQGIVERHGGTIQLSSQEGKGTTVEIRFPIYSKSPVFVSDLFCIGICFLHTHKMLPNPSPHFIAITLMARSIPAQPEAKRFVLAVWPEEQPGLKKFEKR